MQRHDVSLLVKGRNYELEQDLGRILTLLIDPPPKVYALHLHCRQPLLESAESTSQPHERLHSLHLLVHLP